jgi:hypothetical protein
MNSNLFIEHLEVEKNKRLFFLFYCILFFQIKLPLVCVCAHVLQVFLIPIYICFIDGMNERTPQKKQRELQFSNFLMHK